MSAYNPDSIEFQGMRIWERCFWLSRAYIEASACLVGSMLKDDFSCQYSSSRVVIHLARQGVELFLKGALLIGTERSSLPGHNLARLMSSYQERYPDTAFWFKAPVQFALSEADDLFPRDLDSFHSTLDQRHRYPSDLAGRRFDEPEMFDPTAFSESIAELGSELTVIEFRRIRPAFEAVGEPHP